MRALALRVMRSIGRPAVALVALAPLAGCAQSDGPPAPSPVAATEAATTQVGSGAVPKADPSAGARTGSAAPSKGESKEQADSAPEGMVKIPAAVYLMGAYHAVGNPEERPAHEASVPAFYLDKTEVTMAAYRTCRAAGACTETHVSHRFCNEKMEGQEDHPVNCVDLRQAAAYCQFAGKRLPTEREWEYAASGDERRRFSWGEEDPDAARNACYDHAGGSCKVASFPAGAFGLYDMTGNVWEWTQSEFTPYPSRAGVDAIVDAKHYAYRGGSWSRRFPKWMRNLLRNRYQPHMFSASIGLRCAKQVEPLECPPETAASSGECVRTSGTPRCEPDFGWNADRKACVLGGAGATAGATWKGPTAGSTAAAPDASAGPRASAASAEAADPAVITRSRTPQYDADCQKHWPKTPASYLFSGGINFPSRMPSLRAAGCVPRDMGWKWTSACCAG